MKSKVILKGIIIIFISLVCLIATLILNDSINNDLISILIMIIFFVIECYGLFLIKRQKYQR